MYVLDTCICVDLMRGKLPLAQRLMESADPHIFAVPAIVVAELSFGIQKSKNPGKTRYFTERFLAPLRILPFDESCAAAHGPIRNQLRREGILIGPNDLLIAATALAHQATLVTNNINKFKRITGLHLESWYEIDL